MMHGKWVLTFLVFIYGLTHVNGAPLQQDDNYRDFFSWITTGGLRYAAARLNGSSDSDARPLFRAQVPPEKKQSVIIVGAGMAGLSAAFELAQIGHNVTILEMNSRVGGRVKTMREGFQGGLHAEAGAMRIPPNHFLTENYISLFQIPTRKFQNYQEKAYTYLFGDKIRMKEFRDNNSYYSDLYWPGWDANLTNNERHHMNGIVDYFDKTLKPVKRELGHNPTEQEWQAWSEKWSKLSIEDFLRSSIYQDPHGPLLRPWPEVAIEGFKSSTYMVNLGVSLAWFLRDDLGEWWTENMITPVDGMDALPRAFAKSNVHGWNSEVYLSKNIVFGCRVDKVELTNDNPKLGFKQVRVSGYNMFTSATEVYEGDAVILTVPLQILRQMDVPLDLEHRKAVAGITMAPATKILMQCRTRFWQKDVGQGGFSKTNMMIGQLHYPDYDGSGIPDNARGILLVYTWYENAVSFGAETPDQAIKEAVREVAKIHPEIETEFEVGQVEAWDREPSALGAFATPKPFEHDNTLKILKRPVPPIYLAGEAISTSNGWIQGALFSGLMQAFLFQARVEGHGDIDPTTMLYNLHSHT